MEKLKRNIQADISVTPNEVAELFCSMDGSEQAEFFNQIGVLVKTWNMGFIFQMQAVCDTEQLTIEGRKIMKEIGDYSDGLSWMKQNKIDQFIANIPSAD